MKNCSRLIRFILRWRRSSMSNFSRQWEDKIRIRRLLSASLTGTAKAHWRLARITFVIKQLLQASGVQEGRSTKIIKSLIRTWCHIIHSLQQAIEIIYKWMSRTVLPTILSMHSKITPKVSGRSEAQRIWSSRPLDYKDSIQMSFSNSFLSNNYSNKISNKNNRNICLIYQKMVLSMLLRKIEWP